MRTTTFIGKSILNMSKQEWAQWLKEIEADKAKEIKEIEESPSGSFGMSDEELKSLDNRASEVVEEEDIVLTPSNVNLYYPIKKKTPKVKSHSYEEWLELGLQVRKGEKSTGYRDGEATFTEAQVYLDSRRA